MSKSGITLTTVSNGAAVELFEREWARLLANMQDPNTDPKAARKVMLYFTVKPAEGRDRGSVKVTSDSKLAPHKGTLDEMHVGLVEGKYVAVHYDPTQLGIFDDGREAAVLPIDRTQEQ